MAVAAPPLSCAFALVHSMPMIDDFTDRGFFGPIPVLDRDECHAILGHLLSRRRPAPLDWDKGQAVTSRPVYQVATRPEILEPVKAVLGRDVLLWGAILVSRRPGDVHRPHVDIEASDPEAKIAGVWLGLRGVSRDSSLDLVEGSHRFGHTLQEHAHRRGARRGTYDMGDVVEWAAALDPDSALVRLDVSNGEAILFDGRLWHGSDNTGDRRRHALLLQYAAVDTPIRMPDLAHLEWPFLLRDAPRPPCIVVSGDAHGDVNRIVPPPAPVGPMPFLTGAMHGLGDLKAPDDSDWRPTHLFKGATANVGMLSCHVSILKSGASPHPPHTHEEEELLVVIDGEADLIVESGGEQRTVRAVAGTLAYYPTEVAHTIRAVGERPAQYLMFKWTGPAERSGALERQLRHAGSISVGAEGAFRSRGLFEEATRYLDRLHCHVTELDPGGGYDAHVDAHDVAIVLLEGEIESSGTRLAAPAVLFSSGGQPLDMGNPGNDVARYAVFEFHGSGPLDRLGPSRRKQRRRDGPTSVEGPEQGRRSLLVRAWRQVWGAGGRALRPFPRLRNGLRRLLRPFAPG
jgi:mannose-6-phosphate isomerase-like protein (cupin superfamily)